MTESRHIQKLELREQLLDELDIRRGLRGKLFYLYPETFKTLHLVLEEAEEFDWLIQMHTVQAMSDSGKGTVYFDEDLSHNAQLILQEIFDDYWACCLCFQNGFTKQAQAILRSTLELLVQLYHLRYLNESNSLASDAWAQGKRGIEKFADKLAVLKKARALKNSNFAAQLDRLYGLLCTSTHSRKDRLVTTNLPRLERAKDMPSFEPLEILYTRGLFSSVLDLELKMIQKYFEESPETMWVEKIRTVIANMLKLLGKMQPWIQNFQKGYIIRREHIALSTGKQVLYSINLDKRLEFPARKKPQITRGEFKEFRDKVEKRVVKDVA